MPRKAAVARAQAQLRVAQAQVPSASAALARANADYERYSSLVRTGDASQQQLDATRATQAQALAAVSSRARPSNGGSNARRASASAR